MREKLGGLTKAQVEVARQCTGWGVWSDRHGSWPGGAEVTGVMLAAGMCGARGDGGDGGAGG